MSDELIQKTPDKKLINVKGGGSINFDSDPWIFKGIGKDIRLSFSELNLGNDLRESIKKTLAWYLENHSITHANNMYGYFKHFLKSKNEILIENITGADLLNYRSHLSVSNQYYLGSMGGFIKKIYQSGYPGIDKSAIDLLSQIIIKGNKKGEAVRTADPDIGAYTEIETQALFRELKNKFHSKEISLKEYSLFSLFLAFGMRNIQYAQMKVCDIQYINGRDGADTYLVKIPRGKKRVIPRSSFLEMRLNPEAGALILEYANQVRSKYVSELQDVELLPLFPGKFTSEQVNAFRGHLTSGEISAILNKIEKKLAVISERTGEVINISGVRFRRSIGTRAVEEGHGLLTVAALLDHEDTQNVGVYVEATSTMIDKIDKAVAFKLAPMAQAFKGKLIAGPSQASRADDPSSLIRSSRFDSTCKPMGNCGEFGFCNLMAPISCYTCSNFEPWLDGPHEKVLDFLLGERERLSAKGDTRIAAVNDQTILAVSQVILIRNKQLGFSNE